MGSTSNRQRIVLAISKQLHRSAGNLFFKYHLLWAAGNMLRKPCLSQFSLNVSGTYETLGTEWAARTPVNARRCRWCGGLRRDTVCQCLGKNRGAGRSGVVEYSMLLSMQDPDNYVKNTRCSRLEIGNTDPEVSSSWIAL
jgi:hypothetical protein